MFLQASVHSGVLTVKVLSGRRGTLCPVWAGNVLRRFTPAKDQGHPLGQDQPQTGPAGTLSWTGVLSPNRTRRYPPYGQDQWVLHPRLGRGIQCCIGDGVYGGNFLVFRCHWSAGSTSLFASLCRTSNNVSYQERYV